MNVGSNEESLITFNGDNIEEYDKHDIDTNIEFESIETSIKKYWFNQRMVDFVNKLEWSNQTYQTNGNVRD